MKLYRMDVSQPVSLTPKEAGNSNTVDTTLAFDWRNRNDSGAEWAQGSSERTIQMRQALHQHQPSQLRVCYYCVSHGSTGGGHVSGDFVCGDSPVGT